MRPGEVIKVMNDLQNSPGWVYVTEQMEMVIDDLKESIMEPCFGDSKRAFELEVKKMVCLQLIEYINMPETEIADKKEYLNGIAEEEAEAAEED